MLIFRFILLFGGPSRIGLHTLIKKRNTLFFTYGALLLHLFSHCVLNARLSYGDMSPLLKSLVGAAHAHYLTGRM